MADIKDKKTYNEKMQKSLIDKIFFMDKVEAEIYVDFGCANGHLLRVLANLFPEHTYIGYDISEEMINEAKSHDNPSNLIFTTKWEGVEAYIDRERSNDVEGFKTRVCLILSSVIHEVYSYGPENVKSFWKTVFSDKLFDFIVIRDMCVSKTCSRPSDFISVARIRQLFDAEKLSQWETQWGSLEENWSLTHFLLSYHYENWEREYRENYLPVCKENLLKMFPVNFFPVFVEHYTLPYLRKKIFKDFGIQLQERTHIKIIMERI